MTGAAVTIRDPWLSPARLNDVIDTWYGRFSINCPTTYVKLLDLIPLTTGATLICCL